MLSRIGRPLLANLLYHIAVLLKRMGATPNGISLVGFAITFAAALLVATGSLRLGGALLLLGASFDMLDGALARATGQISRFGAFLDSTLDRYSESVIFLALVLHLAGSPSNTLLIGLATVALIGSWGVSYTRARAEGLQIDCKVGILQRPERQIILIIGLLAGWLTPALWILAVLTNVTALQRVYEVYRNTIENNSLPAAGFTGESTSSEVS